MRRQLRGLGGPITKLIIFAVITVLLTGVLAASIANIGGGSGSSYKALFEDATSLNVGDDVRIGGVKVGQVETVKVVDRNRAEVEFSVNRDGGLPASTTAAIKYRNLVGQRFLSLAAGEDGQSQMLEAGDTIPLEQTTPSLNLTMLFNGFRPLFKTLQPEDVNELAYSIIQVFQGEGETMTNLVASTSSLANTVADKDKVIGEVINNLNGVLETVNEHSDQFDQMIVNTRDLVAGLAADKDTVGQSIQSLANLTDATQGLLEPIRPSLQGSIAGLNKLTTELNANGEEVDRVLQTLPVKYEALNRPAMYGSWFQFYLCGLDVVLGPGQSRNLNLPDFPTVNTPLYTNIAPRCHAEGGQ
ncbi:MCE family protein [Tomitella biformata]|uniref:MCE family protein n=1 Tax=Tomitella biformata TaxID=630403 RepID=UPI0004634B92|nr:MlaD family protein [Tomitella biformata]